MLPSNARPGKKDKLDANAVRKASLTLKRAIQNPRSIRLSRRQLLLLLFTFLFVTLLLRRRERSSTSTTVSHKKVPWGGKAQNWGDYVAMGLARQKVLDATPVNYADLSDSRLFHLPGDVYRARGFAVSPPASAKARRAMTAKEERDRHGLLGGANSQWSTGLVGSGTFFGHDVDMRKRAHPDNDEPSVDSGSAKDELAQHILAHGWEFLDDKDKENTEKLLAEAAAEDSWDKLPLRQQVRDDPVKRREAAQTWSNIYTAMNGDTVKSALEVSLERLVRRSPVVVFSKTYCPHSKRAKDMLAQHKIDPPPYIVEVDIRPDGSTVKDLLTRKTGHSTFPNVIIGSRSIGGADDLAALVQGGGLEPMLKELGVSMS